MDLKQKLEKLFEETEKVVPLEECLEMYKQLLWIVMIFPPYKYESLIDDLLKTGDASCQ